MTTSADQIELDVAKHVLRRDGTGRPRYFSEEARAAMRMLENLINAGDLALVPDAWTEGQMRFVAAPLLTAAKVEQSEPAVTAIQGEAMSFMLDPLEQAIASTITQLNDHAVFLAESNLSDVQRAGMRFLGEKLNSHLNHLLTAQLTKVTADETV